MLQKIRILVFIFLFLSQVAFSQTTIPGGYVSGTWTAAASPYNIHGDITIHADSILIIEPGVDVIFQNFYGITVEGALIANGTRQDSISFTAADTVIGWQGLEILQTADTTHLNHCIIEYGRATGNDDNGGGIYCLSRRTDITNCTIQKNEAEGHGGGLYIDVDIGNPPRISNCGVYKNYATSSGGGIFYDGPAIILNDCNVVHNICQDRGAGIYCFGWLNGRIEINNCIFEYNTARYGTGNGGGIYLHNGAGQGIFISECQFLTNNADNNGGGIYIDYAIQDVLIDKCHFYDNYCPTAGGFGGSAICAYGGNLVVSHCIFDENISIEGGTYFCSGSSQSRIESCTFTNNVNYNLQGIIRLWSDATLVNTIVSGSRGGTAGIIFYTGIFQVNHCDFSNNSGVNFAGSNIPSGIGELVNINANGDSCDIYSNIFLDPLFADTTNGDYRITWANWPIADSTKSPCIDAGDPASPKDPDNTVADIGAFYFNQMRPLILASDSLLDFGVVDIGQSQDLPLMIFNTGTDSLSLYNILNKHSVFTHNWNPADSLVLPGDSFTVMVSYAPVDTNLIVDTLLIENNDKPLQIQLQGKGNQIVGIADNSTLPKVYALYPAYPNPFNPVTHISFDVPRVSKVTLMVYDILGRKVSTLVNKKMHPGKYELTWDSGDLPSGLYFYRLEVNEYIDIRKMVLIK